MGTRGLKEIQCEKQSALQAIWSVSLNISWPVSPGVHGLTDQPDEDQTQRLSWPPLFPQLSTHPEAAPCSRLHLLSFLPSESVM